uniref:LINE-1 type transposase domain-containing protein 1 n=1 Tax=Chinchilla lanigera TaxID=34839 RepID=A0A8C2V0Z3_CHILA
MPGIRAKLARAAKGQEEVHRRGKRALTERAGATALEPAYEDASGGDRNELTFLKEGQDLVFEEMVQTLTRNIRKLLEAKITPEVKNSKSSSSRKGRQEVKHLTSPKMQLVEKTEDSKVGENTESLISKQKPRERRRKSDKAQTHNRGQGKKLSAKDKVRKRVGGASHRKEGRRNRDAPVQALQGECREGAEREPGKKVGARRNLEGLREADTAVKEERLEERPLRAEGATLTLAADFPATLEVSRQWAQIFSILGENGLDPRFLCKVELAFKCDGEIQTFSDLQSLREFTSQKASMKDLLKDVFAHSAGSHGEGRHGGPQRKGDNPSKASKCGAGDPASDGLNFLFIKEVKVAGPEGRSAAPSEWKGKESSKVEEQEALWLEEEEENSGEEEEEEEQEEETSGEEEEEEEEQEEETSGEEEEEEISGEEEEEEAQEEETLGEEEEEDSTGEEEEEEEQEEETSGEEEGEDSTGAEEEGDSETEVQQEGEGSSGMEEEELEQQEAGGSPSTEGEEAPPLREELVCLPSVGKKEKPVQPGEEHRVEEEEDEIAAGRGHGIEIRGPTLHWSALSKPLEGCSGEHRLGSWANLSTPLGVPKFLGKTEKERHKALQREKLTSEEADFIQETEENFRRSVMSIFREMREQIERIRSRHPDISEIKPSVDALNSRVGKLEERMSHVDDQMEELSKDAARMSRQLVKSEKLRAREDEFRSSNIRVIGVPEKDRKTNEAEDIIKEIIKENFPELRMGSGLEVVSAQRVPSRVDERKLTPRHILVTFWSPSEREKILKASREREVTFRGRSIRLTADFSLSTLDARSQWCDIINVLHRNGFHPRIRYPAKLTFDFEGNTRTFFDTDEFRRFVSHVPSLKGLLENVL